MLSVVSMTEYLQFGPATQRYRSNVRRLLSAVLPQIASYWRVFSMLSMCCASRSRARTYQDKIGFTYAAIGRTAQRNGPNAR